MILFSVPDPSDEAPSSILCQKQDAMAGHCWFDTGGNLHMQESLAKKE